MKLNKIFFILIFLFILCFSSHSISFIPYQGLTKKIITDHFVILYPKQYEKTAQKTAAYAEDIHQKISEFMKWDPIHRTTIIISDHTDYPNASALTFYRNTINLYIAPLDLHNTLRSFEDPLYSLILHEYVHILHLDQIRGGAWFWRVMYGKLYCPNSGTFRWYIEGVAVLAETLYAEGGRLKSSYNHAIVRTAAKQKKIPSFDKLVLPVVDWPHGEAVYHYGAKFVEYLYYEYGEEKFQDFFVDISNDFWPFVLQFVIKFKKIYGKSLKDLWNEWKIYEENQAELYPESSNKNNKLTNLAGSISSFDRGKDFFIIASSSYKNDSYLYKLYDDGNLKKINLGNYRSISLTNNENYIVCTSVTNQPGNFYYSNLYSINLKTKIKRKLIDLNRINYVSFAQNSPMGVFVAHSGKRSRLFKAEFHNGKIKNIREIKIPPEIIFIDCPDIFPDGEKAVFAARTNDNNFRLFLLNLNDNTITLIDDSIKGKNVKWIDNDTISYISFDEESDSIYSFSIKDKTNKKILSTNGSILDGIVIDNNVYYIDYSIDGEELYSGEISETIENAKIKDSSFSLSTTDNLSDIDFNDKNWKTTYYGGFRYLYPLIWGLIPFQLDSSINYSVGNGSIGIPFYGPKFFIYNILPQGRFSYYLDIGLDYLKMYPENNLVLNAKLPFINLSYSWSNWKGGSKFLYDNLWYEQKYLNNFPINFRNSLNANYTYRFGDGFSFFWYLSVTHEFNQYNFSLLKPANFLHFTESIGFSYIKSRNKSTRWDRGIVLNLTFLQYPPLLPFDNYIVNLIRGAIIGRIPLGSAFCFFNIEAGIETLNQNVFKVNSDLYRFSENILGSSTSNSSNSLSIVDTKAFPSLITSSSYGSFFVSVDTGFDITVVKKSQYWHFATLGFKEFYISPYVEFVYIYNRFLFNERTRGILFDGVLELAVDLFAAYGNITVTIVNGGALGYRIGDSLPAWSVFSYFKVGL